LLFAILSVEHCANGYAGHTVRPAIPERPAMPTIPTSDVNVLPQLLLTRKQAAAARSVSERTLWALTWPRGPIRSVRIGRSVRYAADVLRAWVESQQKATDR
jgi:hypothetical protein